MSESYYRYHLFFCTHQRDDGTACCAHLGGQQMRDFAKAKIKELGLNGAGGVRINNAGCLGRCAEGPVAVVYPNETWYTYVDQEDIEEIIESHLQNGQPVERLKL